MADISDPLERKFLVQDLLKEKESDEEESGNELIESGDESLSDEEQDAKGLYDKIEVDVQVEEKEWQKYMSNTPRSRHNTGPKGVKADYEEARSIMRRLNETKVLKAREALRASQGVLSTTPSVSYNSVKNTSKMHGVGGTASNVTELKEVINKIKDKRLKELKAVKTLPQFGQLRKVDKFQFLEETDGRYPETFVVIHLYEEYLLACKRINQVMEKVAANRPHINFLMLQATEVDATLSHTALPAFMVYKAGKIVNDIAINFSETVLAPLGANDQLSRFGIDEFEWFLSSRFGIPFPGRDIASDTRLKDLNLSDEKVEKVGKISASHGFKSSRSVKTTHSKQVKRNNYEVDNENSSGNDSSDGDW